MMQGNGWWCSDSRHVVEHGAESCICGLVLVMQPSIDNVNAAQERGVLEAALREALRMVNNKYVAEVYSTNPRGDVNTFCIALRDRLADTLAALAASPREET